MQRNSKSIIVLYLYKTYDTILSVYARESIGGDGRQEGVCVGMGVCAGVWLCVVGGWEVSASYT